WPATDRAAGTGAATTAHQATPHEPPANEKCTNDATGNGAAPGDPRVADRSGPSRQTPEQGPNRDAGKPVNARSLASQLHELFEVDLRLEDMLVQEIKKQRSRRKHPLELVR